MSDAAAGANDHDHGIGGYIKIYFILLFLFILSVLGPEVAKHMDNATMAKVLVLVTAFGIAIVKAGMVAAWFMHLNVEKRYIWYMLYTMLIFVGLFFAGVAADVMVPKGTNWVNEAALQHIEENTKPASGDHN